jgi:hypothetical protein
MLVWVKDRKVSLLVILHILFPLSPPLLILSFRLDFSPHLLSIPHLPTSFFLYLPLAASSNMETGLLVPLGDPLGSALNKGLSPLGTAIGGITNGGYTKSKEMDKAAEEQQSVGGKEQSGQNPLGL